MVAQELNLPLGTLKGWLSHPPTQPDLPHNVTAQSWSSAQKLQALKESYTLTGSDLNAWCREKGLFEHQLKQWQQAFCQSLPTGKADPAYRALEHKTTQLERELRRKEKALAEAAALLVLQKKFRALLEDEAK